MGVQIPTGTGTFEGGHVLQCSLLPNYWVHLLLLW